MKPLALAAATYCAMSLLAVTVWAVVAPRLLRDEDAHDETCVAPCCDVGPDDPEAVAEAVGVVPAEKWDEALARFVRQVEFETRDLAAAVSVPEDFR